MAITSIKTGSSFTNLQKYNDFLGPNAAYDPAATWLIQRINATGSSTTVSFTSIPSTYKSLQIRATFSAAATSGSVFVQANGDTGSNYAVHRLNGSGSTVAAQASTSTGYPALNAAVNLSATYPSSLIIDIHDYASTTKNKTMRAIYGLDTNSSVGEIDLTSVLWMSTSAINRLDVFAGTNFTSTSTFALYGMK